MRREWPDTGDLVVCTVRNVMDFGAFMELDEYGGKEGLIHISEVAPGWIKYIRDHVREGQKTVCKVLNVDPNRGHIDLSLKDVNEHQRREKIRSWKNEQKAEKWLTLALEVLDADESTHTDIMDKLLDAYGSVYAGLEEATIEGMEVLTDLGIDKKYGEEVYKVATSNIKIPSVEISGYVDLTCPLPDGVKVIKKALKSAANVNGEDVEIDVSYIGAPAYRIKVTAPDYKMAENILRKSAEAAINTVKNAEGMGEFHRHWE